jgi:hypothetical protein
MTQKGSVICEFGHKEHEENTTDTKVCYNNVRKAYEILPCAQDDKLGYSSFPILYSIFCILTSN